MGDVNLTVATAAGESAADAARRILATPDATDQEALTGLMAGAFSDLVDQAQGAADDADASAEVAKTAATSLLTTSAEVLPDGALATIMLVDEATFTPYAALGVNNRIWVVDQAGEFTAVDTSGKQDPSVSTVFETSADILSGPGLCSFILIDDSTFKPILALGENGLYVVQDGVLASVAGGAPGAVSYAAVNVTDAFGAINTLRRLTDPTILPTLIDWEQSFGGSNPSASDTPYSITARHPGRCLTFDGGPWLDEIGQDVTEFVDAVAFDPGGGDSESGSVKEPPIIETINTLIDIVDATFGEGSCQPILGFNMSAGGHRIAALAPGTDVWNDGIRLMRRAREIAAAQGKRPLLIAVISAEGQQDNKEYLPIDMFGRAMANIAIALNDAARAEFPAQQSTAPLVMLQNGRAAPGVDVDAYAAQGALYAEDLSPLVVVGGPNYFADADPETSTHPAATGYVAIGALFGHVVARAALGIGHLSPKVRRSYWTAPNVLRLIYPYPMTIDTSGDIVGADGVDGVGPIDGVAGFRWRDDSNSVTVTSVAAVGLGAFSSEGAIDVTLSGAPGLYNQRLFIGTRPSGLFGRLQGPRTQARATASLGDDVRGKPVYLWACQQTVIPGQSRLH